MKILHNEEGKILGIGADFVPSEGQFLVDVEEESVESVRDYKIKDGKLLKITKDERASMYESVSVLEESLEVYKDIFDNDSNTIKDRITAIVNYLKEIKVIR